MPWSSSSFLNPRRRRRTNRLRHRRHNPLHALRRRHHRRRNPFGISTGGIMGMLKDAAMMAAGAIAIDLAWGQINPLLPASMQSNPTAVSVGDAVKVAATVGIGIALDRPTNGLAKKAALGALVVQLHDLIAAQLGPNVKLAGMGFMQPTAVVQGQHWVGPNKRRMGAGMGFLTAPGGASPLLRGMGFLTQPGQASPLLRGLGRVQFQRGGSNLVSASHGISFK